MLRQPHRLHQRIMPRRNPLMQQQRPRRRVDRVKQDEAQPPHKQQPKPRRQRLHKQERSPQQQRRQRQPRRPEPRKPRPERQRQQRRGNPPHPLQQPRLPRRNPQVLPDKWQEQPKGVRNQNDAALLGAKQKQHRPTAARRPLHLNGRSRVHLLLQERLDDGVAFIGHLLGDVVAAGQ